MRVRCICVRYGLRNLKLKFMICLETGVKMCVPARLVAFITLVRRGNFVTRTYDNLFFSPEGHLKLPRTGKVTPPSPITPCSGRLHMGLGLWQQIYSNPRGLGSIATHLLPILEYEAVPLSINSTQDGRRRLQANQQSIECFCFQGLS